MSVFDKSAQQFGHWTFGHHSTMLPYRCNGITYYGLRLEELKGLEEELKEAWHHLAIDFCQIPVVTMSLRLLLEQEVTQVS